MFSLRGILNAIGKTEEAEKRKKKGVGWTYFLSGELYGATLCVMTAEWIIVSPSILRFSAFI